jgi:hypothetical protein
VDDVALRGQLARRARLGGAERLEVFHRLAVAVAQHHQRIALGDDVLGHAVAHQADADEADGGAGGGAVHLLRAPAPLSAR